MKNILSFILNFLTGSPFSDRKTDDSLTAGSEDSIGSGGVKTNEQSINWTYIIILVLVGIGCWFIPSPFQGGGSRTGTGNDIYSTVNAIPGIPDTSFQDGEVSQG